MGLEDRGNSIENKLINLEEGGEFLSNYLPNLTPWEHATSQISCKKRKRGGGADVVKGHSEEPLLDRADKNNPLCNGAEAERAK